MSEDKQPEGPDLTQGVPASDLGDGAMLAGHVGDETVLLARQGADLFAISATCTHYGGPLADGLLVGDTVRCPWHHACFSLRTGEAIRAPAFDPVSCWRVERRGDRIVVADKLPAPKGQVLQAAPGVPDRVVIVGGGAAGFAAAERLRREGYAGALTILSDDADAPYDRPNLSKDFLAGQAPEDFIPLRPDSFYTENGIDLRLRTSVAAIDPRNHRVVLADGSDVPFDRLLIATGAEPVRPPIPGAEAADILVLRSVRDCRAIIARAETARRAVLIGAGFIGLEVAASLRQRGLDVHVVAPDRRPLEKIVGPALGDLVRQVHEGRGVAFHLSENVALLAPNRVTLANGTAIETDLVILGTGVKPRTHLAESAGLAVDNGVLVNACLETSAAGIFAAGDVARWPDPHSGERIRVEHWVVAERMGQTAALNILGRNQPFDTVPFFWSQHFDELIINYLGHAASWDSIEVDGDLGSKRALLRYRRDGRVLAVATVDRDLDNLRIEAEMETAGATA
jgi:NADPH-dependent 2,4-dienoyl-CoA reductase/sulfur reductase-like enzyme/nitrite reductase/ring-hydroxylating ferredoxin subunit